MKSEAPEQKNEGLGWPCLKFLDHYYGSYEHLIIADCSIVSPLFCHFRFW